MKRMAILILLAFVLNGCEYIPTNVIHEENDTEVPKDTLLDAINKFKAALYKLVATNHEVLKMISSPTEADTSVVHTKDELDESKMNVGYDLEWLDMAVQVLNFAQEFTNASDTLVEEILFYDVLDDPGIWGWEIYDSTKVILRYTDEVLYLRVIDDLLIQTFFFEYVEEDLIRILRFFEQVTPRGNALYIEDFIQETGLSMWHSNGTYLLASRVTSEDGGLYTIWSSGSEEKTFGFANYTIHGVPIYMVAVSNEELYVEYDFKYVEVFDSFNEEGLLFLNEEIVEMPLVMNVRPAYHGAETFILTGGKALSEPADSLKVEEAHIQTELTCEDIRFNIDSLLTNAEHSGILYDYSLGVEFILNDLSDLLYLDY
ncbi:MAG: hypothetical protein WD578_05600 [Bacteroidales bacterium]